MDELVKIALVGTAKYPGTPTLDANGPDALLASLATQLDQSPENLVLLRAGAAALYAQAGFTPLIDNEATAPSPADEGPRGSRRLIGLLQNALATDAKELLREFARLMKSAGLMAPPEVLPAMLNIQEPELREELLPVLGNRGRWLSQFNPVWHWVSSGIGALGGDEQARMRNEWANGNIAERCIVLRGLRAADPAEARRVLGEVFKVEKPEYRSRLLEQFETNLSADDESFLEEKLSDRSEIVRLSAAQLLAKLPESQLALRMMARADEMLVVAAESKPGNLKLDCKPPAEIDAAWKRDGVPDRGEAGRGKRAVSVLAVLRAVSPGHWTERFQARPEKIIAAVHDDTYADAVIEGWTEAAINFSDQPSAEQWLTPLWDDWLQLAIGAEPNKLNAIGQLLTRLLDVLPAKQAEVCLNNLMRTGGAAQSLAPDLISAAPRPWSAAFSRKYIKAVLERINSTDNSAYRWICTLSDAAKAIAPECFAEALSSVESATSLGQNTNYTNREIEKFVEIIRMRQTFYEEISA